MLKFYHVKSLCMHHRNGILIASEIGTLNIAKTRQAKALWNRNLKDIDRGLEARNIVSHIM